MSIEITHWDGRVLYAAKSAQDVRAAVMEAVSRGAVLSDADLSGAVLRGAVLRDAYLRGADLSDADVRGADLRDAYLRGADLSDADLSDAVLRGAVLSGADLSDAKNADLVIAQTRILPDEGDVIGWKLCRGGILAKLLIPGDAKRSNASGRKCRAERAEVLALTDSDGGAVESATSKHDPAFTYRVGETVTPATPFDADPFIECGSGIHFFITRIEAEKYT